MTQYYHPTRSASWNYGGQNWKLSRSKIDLFLECPRCFYLDNKLGVKRPPGFPFALNSAIDHLLKREFDIHRAQGTPHPLITKYGVDARPVADKHLAAWRHNFTGIQYQDPQSNFTISGAIDDLWINSHNEYIVVDYKSTSKTEAITALDKDWQGGYKRQMEVYQWLLRQNGYPVSNLGYFVYCNGKTDKEAFDAKLEFDITLIPYEGDDGWVGDTISEIKRTLDQSQIPAANPACDFCAYRQAAEKFEV